MTTEKKTFCPVSLGDWLEVCQRAGVPAIAAQQVAEVRKTDYLNWTDDGPVRERLMAAYGKMRDFAASDYMMRYDCCSSTDVKAALAHGKPEWHEDFATLMLDDPRVYELIEQYPREIVPVWQRPWVKAKIHDGYPVEYRVFVKDGRVVGISNYYPQRPLPLHTEHIDKVCALTEQLIGELFDVQFEWNVGLLFVLGQEKLDLGGMHFSADFLVDADDEVLFIEGGPPHELGAHECCFNAGDVDGLALADGEYKRAVWKVAGFE